MERVYACIDLKSFYASVECVERGLNPLTTNLVVADEERTEKTICLAVTPSLKKYGISGRARLFEVVQRVKEINRDRRKEINTKFKSKSYDDTLIKKDKYTEIDFIRAVPRMKLYMDYSAKIYSIYLKYLSKEDIYVYSIDEVFCDLTSYLKYYKTTPEKLIRKMIKDVYKTTGITATGGIGTNMFLAKVAMDIVAKKKEPDEYGVRIAYLDSALFKKELWDHKPLTDFWRIGSRTAKKLDYYYIHTMKDIAKCSLEDENFLYRLFGINAELLIDHAWGYEPCTLSDIKKYKPKSKSISEGQVLHKPYNYKDTKLIVEEMSEVLAMNLTGKKCITDLLNLYIGYDVSNVDDNYTGEVVVDHYGRKVPVSAHGSIRLDYKTSNSKLIREALIKVFESIADKNLYVRRINISAANLEEDSHIEKTRYEQIDLFNDIEKVDYDKEKENIKLQNEILNIKNKYGKNSILKAMNLMEGGTTINRNREVGGHRA